jgi:hypothetical protein
VRGTDCGAGSTILNSSMRPITRRLRLFAAVLGLAQAAVPALALAHELSGSGYGAPSAHVESQGASHEVAAHSHECGLCRHVGSRHRPATGQPLGVGDDLGARHGDWAALDMVVHGHVGSIALPRGPPVG